MVPNKNMRKILIFQTAGKTAGKKYVAADIDCRTGGYVHAGPRQRLIIDRRCSG